MQHVGSCVINYLLSGRRVIQAWLYTQARVTVVCLFECVRERVCVCVCVCIGIDSTSLCCKVRMYINQCITLTDNYVYFCHDCLLFEVLAAQY